jgi:hypothetical protein
MNFMVFAFLTTGIGVPVSHERPEQFFRPGNPPGGFDTGFMCG